MKLTRLSALTGLVAGGCLALSSSPAQAFSFTTNYTAEAGSRGNIWLNSVTLGDGSTVSDFSLVKRANLIANDSYTGGNTGAASSDRGDEASGVQLEAATSGSIVSSLGNLNLNNIIDTEDTGSFVMDLFFESAVDTLFFWERGMNSKLAVQAIDAAGNLLGSSLLIDSSTWAKAGFNINTTEIGDKQAVGSLGLNLADLGLSGSFAGVRLVSEASFNGPDFKVVGAATESVPEPATLAGLGLIGGGLVLSRRRKAKQA